MFSIEKVIEMSKNSTEPDNHQCLKKLSELVILDMPEYAEPNEEAPKSGKVVYGYTVPDCEFEPFNMNYQIEVEEILATKHDDWIFERLEKVLNKMGVHFRNHHYWEPCCECGRLVRTCGDEDEWTPYYKERRTVSGGNSSVAFETTVVCNDCVERRETK